jgi:hypothetical protein
MFLPLSRRQHTPVIYLVRFLEAANNTAGGFSTIA